MLYFIIRAYHPNTAELNRIFSYLRNLSENRIEVNVIFCCPSKNKVDFTLPYITFSYLFDRYKNTNIKVFDHIINKVAMVRLRKSFKPGDTIYIYSQPEVVHCMSKRKDIHVFAEMTEHPYTIGYRNPLTTISWPTYFRACCRLDGLIVISNELRDFFISQGVESKKIYIINMIVNPQRFNNVLRNMSAKDRPYIAYCGVIFNNKDGVDDLIKAFAIVSNKYPDYQLQIIGPTPNSHDVNTNITLIDEYNLSDKVLFTGEIPSENIPQILVNARICALARPDNLRSKAGFPTKLGEYLLSKNPVILTSVGDIPFFLTHQKSAILAEPNNYKDFANKLCWIIEHPDEASKIGMEGYNVAMRHFNAKIETEKLLKILLNIN